MDRSLRRFHAARIRVRKRRILSAVWVWPPYRSHWEPIHKLTMNGYPKAWDTVFHIRPARARANQALRLTLRGVPDELLHWPDYRKPHIYYW